MARDVPADDYSHLCNYTIQTNLNTCPESQVSDSNVCISDAVLVDPHTSSLNVTSTRFFYRFWIPQHTGNVHINLKNAKENTYIKGTDYSPVGYPRCTGHCRDDGGEIDLYCDTPRRGWFYLLFTNDNGLIQGDLHITLNTCPDDTLSGTNCDITIHNLMNVTSGTEYTIIDGTETKYEAFYFDFKNVSAYNTYNISFTLISGEYSWFYLAKNGDTITSGYHDADYFYHLNLNIPLTIVLNWADIYLGRIYYFGVSSEGSTDVTFRVDFEQMQSNTTTTTSTSTAGTSAGTSTSEQLATSTGNSVATSIFASTSSSSSLSTTITTSTTSDTTTTSTTGKSNPTCVEQCLAVCGEDEVTSCSCYADGSISTVSCAKSGGDLVSGSEKLMSYWHNAIFLIKCIIK